MLGDCADENRLSSCILLCTAERVDEMKATCHYCKQPIAETDAYRNVGISLTGWPKELPRTLVAHRHCRDEHKAVTGVIQSDSELSFTGAMW